jgi:hypothetical protein
MAGAIFIKRKVYHTENSFLEQQLILIWSAGSIIVESDILINILLCKLRANGKRFRRAEQLPAQGMLELYDLSAPALRGKRGWTRVFSWPVEPSTANAC